MREKQTAVSQLSAATKFELFHFENHYRLIFYSLNNNKKERKDCYKVKDKDIVDENINIEIA